MYLLCLNYNGITFDNKATAKVKNSHYVLITGQL